MTLACLLFITSDESWIQVEPKAQLVLVGCTNGGEKVAQQGHELQSDASITGEDVQPPHLREMSEASDILLAPRFLEDAKTSEANYSIATTELKSVQQAVVLAQYHFIERSARSDELQSKLCDHNLSVSLNWW